MIQGKTMTVAPLQHIVHQPALPLDKIILGDNCEVMRTFPSESIDLVVTSPPYDELRTYGGHSWDFDGVLSQLSRVVKKGGVVVWIVNDATVDGSETGTSFKQALQFMDRGFALWDTMIWDKPWCQYGDTKSRYAGTFEFMFIFSRGRPSVINIIRDRKNQTPGTTRARGDRRVTGDHGGSVKRNDGYVVQEYGPRKAIWEIAVDNPSGNKHPAIFPEALARDHILSWSMEGDVVLDPFSGSGTTAKMAKHNGRRYIGIEVNPEYVEIAEKRLMQQVLF